MWLDFVLAVPKIVCVSILPSHSASSSQVTSAVARKKWLENNIETLKLCAKFIQAVCFCVLRVKPSRKKFVM